LGESEKIDSGQKLVYHILLRPEVYSDLKESFQWYSDQHEILGMEFIEQIESCFERIKSNPYSYQLIKKNLRRAIVRKFPFANGFRYRLHDKKLPGKPDIVLQKYKTVIFVNGCFWHGHKSCKYFVIPKTRTEWWVKKIDRTRLLDHRNNLKLKSDGWKILKIFECELKSIKRHKALNRILFELGN